MGYYKLYNCKEDKPTFSTTIKKIAFGLILSSAVLYSLFHYSAKSYEETKGFLDNVSDISCESNDLLYKIAEEYSSGNFSDSYKDELKSDLKKLHNHSLSSYTDEDFSEIKSNSNKVIDATEECVNLVLNADEPDNNTVYLLNNKLKSAKDDINRNKDLIIEYFKDNNIDYYEDKKNNRIHYVIERRTFFFF